MKADLEHSFLGNVSFLAQRNIHVGQSCPSGGPGSVSHLQYRVKEFRN